MNGAVFIWLTATRPVASWPEPSPDVSLNHGRCAGALAWVRIQTLCLPASVLMASIISRALLDSPPGAGAFIVAVAMGFSPVTRCLFVLTYSFSHALCNVAGTRPALPTPAKRHSVRGRRFEPDQ